MTITGRRSRTLRRRAGADGAVPDHGTQRDIVRAALSDSGLLSPSESRAPGGARRIGVAVSGGMDSMCLLHAVHALAGGRWPVTCLTVDHGMRDFSRELACIRAFCKRRRIPLAVAVLPAGIRQRARREGKSLEEALRDERYRALERMAEEAGLDVVALAHTASDQAETVLLRLLRGCGMVGVAGMRSQRDRLFVRPLLAVTRADVERYVRACRIRFVEDPTNSGDEFLRNRVRHEVLPALERIDAAAVRTLARFADVSAGQAEAFRCLVDSRLDAMAVADPKLGGLRLDRAGLAAAPLTGVLLHRAIERVSGRAPTAAQVRQVEKVLEQGGGVRRVHLRQVLVRVDRTSVLIVPADTRCLRRGGKPPA
jgi:tRNA(Ile)-lysidine synthase